ncbi:amidohydrolase [Methylobacterium nonmethylotrophicum]|nr:amidohydrolase [Methylobacterium nonmethylotrophicum]
MPDLASHAPLRHGDSAPLHDPAHDFDDAALPDGAAFPLAIVRRRLPAA